MRTAAFCVLLSLVTIFAQAATPEQTQRAQEAHARINLYRSIHGIEPVALDNAFIEGCIAHANYLDLNPSQISNPYTEDLSLPGATAAGKAVAEVCILSYDVVGLPAIDALFNGYGTRGFLLAGDFTKAGYGDTPGTSGGRPIAVIRTGETHSPTKLLSPPDGAKGVPAFLAVSAQALFGLDKGPSIILYGVTESSNIEIVSSSVSSGGAAIEHSATATTTSGSRPTLLKDVVLSPHMLPLNALISVVIDYKENGQTKRAEWSFTTSESGIFDPVAAAAALPPGRTPSDTSDADADGFPANVEIAAGTSATDAAATPFSGQPPGAPQPLDIQKAAIKLNFAKPESDSIQFNGALAVPAGFAPTGAQIIVDAAGVARAFSLSDKGSGVNGSSSFKLSKPKDNMAKYKAKLSKGNFAIDLNDNGLSNTTVAAAPVTVPIGVYFNNTVLKKDVAALYTAKQGKTGKAK